MYLDVYAPRWSRGGRLKWDNWPKSDILPKKWHFTEKVTFYRKSDILPPKSDILPPKSDILPPKSDILPKKWHFTQMHLNFTQKHLNWSQMHLNFTHMHPHSYRPMLGFNGSCKRCHEWGLLAACWIVYRFVACRHKSWRRQISQWGSPPDGIFRPACVGSGRFNSEKTYYNIYMDKTSNLIYPVYPRWIEANAEKHMVLSSLSYLS